MRNDLDDHPNANTQAAYTRFAAHNGGIESYAFKIFHGFSEVDLQLILLIRLSKQF